MSQFNTLQLLTDLKADLLVITKQARLLYQHIDDLNTVPQRGKWTVAQVLQHLNFYHDYYLPAIEKAYQSYQQVYNDDNSAFETGLIGGYLTRMMQPDTNGRVTNKTKALKSYIPGVKLNAQMVLDNFITSQERFTDLIDKAQYYDLNTVKVTMSISRLIRLKLGDILRVLVVHQQRHFIQIEEALQLISIPSLTR